MSRVKALIPATIGAVLGAVAVLYPDRWLIGALVIAASAGLGSLVVGRLVFLRAPRAGRWFIEAWMLFLPAMTALCTSLLLWLTYRFEVSGHIAPEGWDPKDVKEVFGVVLTAVSALVAAIVSGDPAQAENPFWPSAQFKGSASKHPVRDAQVDERIYHAAHAESTADNAVKGWGFVARGARAEILARYRSPQSDTADGATQADTTSDEDGGAAAPDAPPE